MVGTCVFFFCRVASWAGDLCWSLCVCFVAVVAVVGSLELGLTCRLELRVFFFSAYSCLWPTSLMCPYGSGLTVLILPFFQ